MTSRILKEYNDGFDRGMLHKSVTQVCREGIRDKCPWVKAYWQGYFDAASGFMRNPNYCEKTQVAVKPS